MQTIPNALQTVMRRPPYVILALIITVVSAALLVVATSIPLQNFQSWLFSTSTTTQFLVAFSAVMLGLIGTVQVYTWRTFKTVRKKPTTLSAGALASTIAATACCSPIILPVVSIVGVGSAFLFLQQHQAYVVLLSAALLLAALHYSCKIVSCKKCRIKTGLAQKDIKPLTILEPSNQHHPIEVR